MIAVSNAIDSLFMIDWYSDKILILEDAKKLQNVERQILDGYKQSHLVLLHSLYHMVWMRAVFHPYRLKMSHNNEVTFKITVTCYSAYSPKLLTSVDVDM